MWIYFGILFRAYIPKYIIKLYEQKNYSGLLNMAYQRESITNRGHKITNCFCISGDWRRWTRWLIVGWTLSVRTRSQYHWIWRLSSRAPAHVVNGGKATSERSAAVSMCDVQLFNRQDWPCGEQNEFPAGRLLIRYRQPLHEFLTVHITSGSPIEGFTF